MAFVHHHAPEAKPAAGDLELVVQADRLLARVDAAGGIELPEIAALAEWRAEREAPLHVGRIDERTCWLSAVTETAPPPPADWAWIETRSVLGALSAVQSHAISCARQLLWWDRRHRFCGVCGGPTVVAVEERARKCPACGATFFPVVSPAVIVAVTRGDELLLAHNRNFRPGMFSLLAGFVDPGETLEQAVVREVREEVGIEVGQLRYKTSQPWSFPNSLMIGFRAEWTAGEIAVDGKEIETAAWFRASALPDVPRPGSLARWLIDAWLAESASERGGGV